MSLSDPQNVLKVTKRSELRDWYLKNAESQPECWVDVKRGNPKNDDGTKVSYLDAVEEALCFGWIDSTFKKIDGVTMQRFSPRRKGSAWTELNKERVRRLERLGLMTDLGRATLPDMSEASFKLDPDVEAALKKGRAFSKFKKFPKLYQRVRAYNVAFWKKKDSATYERMLTKLVNETKDGNMFGEWHDYGRLLEY